MADLIEESVSIHDHETRTVHAYAGHDDDYDISSYPFCNLDEKEKLKVEDEHRKRIERLKRANRKLHRSDVPAVLIENFDDLVFERGKIDEIIASRGKIEIGRMFHDRESATHILSYVFGKLLQGAPGDSGPKALKKNADKFAIDLAPKIAEIRQNPSFKTYRQIAAELTKRKIPTSRGEENDSEWHPTTVRNVETRIEKLKKAGKLRPI